jgi:hypothetical protein
LKRAFAGFVFLATLGLPVSQAHADVVALLASGEAWNGFPFPTDHEHRLVGGALDLVFHELDGYERIGFGLGAYALQGEGTFQYGAAPEDSHDEKVYGGRLSVNATSTGYGYGLGLMAEAGLSPLYAEVANEVDWVTGFYARLGLGGVLGPIVWGAQVGVLSANLNHPDVNLGGLTANVSLGWDFGGHASTLPDEPDDADDDDDDSGEPGLDVDVPRRVPVPPGGVTLLVRVTPQGGVTSAVQVSVRASAGVRWELLPPRAEDPQAWELRIDHVPRDGGTVQVRAVAGDVERETRIELYRGFEED